MPRCETCCHFDHPQGAKRGLCRLAPPVYIASGWEQPRVLPTDRCGQHSPSVVKGKAQELMQSAEPPSVYATGAALASTAIDCAAPAELAPRRKRKLDKG